ncbi:hypothetical protein [Peterkaempfera sp. SMS 1(5)a]|uniref:hypothetical protein n=1 Tax=Peterkaempfera podocarpi TaxID=3232308 RepID=UPI00367342BC
MQRTLVSLAGLVVAVLTAGLGAGVATDATANGTVGRPSPAHVRLADGKSPTGTPVGTAAASAPASTQAAGA